MVGGIYRDECGLVVDFEIVQSLCESWTIS